MYYVFISYICGAHYLLLLLRLCCVWYGSVSRERAQTAYDQAIEILGGPGVLGILSDDVIREAIEARLFS
jgi:hypothetical protein